MKYENFVECNSCVSSGVSTLDWIKSTCQLSLCYLQWYLALDASDVSIP